MSIFLLIYIIAGIICVGYSASAIFVATDRQKFGQKRFLVYLVVVVIVLILWPLWVGIWIGNRYK